MVKVKLVMGYPPSGNQYKRHFCARSSPANPHPVRAALTKEATAYKRSVASALASAGLPYFPAGVHLAMTVRVFRPAARGDADNTVKLLQDCLQDTCKEGVVLAQGVYHNDSQIRELHVYIAEDKNDPRVEVEIHAL